MKKDMDLDLILKGKNLKVTPQRKAILKVILNGNKVVDANEIFSQVVKILPKINYSTVYRNLDVLVTENILCQISQGESGNLYKFRDHEDHHHHIICQSCGQVTSIDFCPMEYIETKVKEIEFKPLRHHFDIYGRCKNCRINKLD